ncbi:RDD family protein [Ramlibacter sp. WS9]|uniref:RDD family protein n=1 Tax=Ramlibacter sp. WS9 TaxID=1882741 RepID=UPI0011421A79|nr:RDD family protein [Ramlibacter sp. WS9]ROZ78725.1 RDD family protein [Ramlibacter sp. WS9]
MPLDTLYTAETPEGIALSLRPAGVVARALAYAVDFGIRLGIFFVIAMIAGALGGMGSAVLLISYFALEWFYPVAFELALGGATPGKRMVGIQVVMDSGLPLTPGASVIRNLLRAADFLPFLYAAGAACMLLRADFKRLGDIAAGTLVVYAESVRLHGEVPAADPLAPARPLALREQVAILAWAGRATRLTPERLEELAHMASPVIPNNGTRAANSSATSRLLGLAQWVLGRRHGQRK